MADSNTIYYPTVIPDTPFPSEPSAFDQTISQPSSAQGVVSPSQIPDQPLPQRIIAQETISQTLDTTTKKILKEFQFTPSGALQIGAYTPGISGDVRISPEGILARDQSGNTTFSLDGDSGSATFRGTVEAAGFTIADETGLHSLNNFQSDIATPSGDTITSTTNVDISNLVLTTPQFSRSVKVMLFLTLLIAVDSTNVSADFSGSGVIEFNVDGNPPGDSPLIQKHAFRRVTPGDTDGTGFETQSMNYLTELGPGTHTLKIRGKVINGSGTGQLTIFADGNFSYIILGN